MSSVVVDVQNLVMENMIEHENQSLPRYGGELSYLNSPYHTHINFLQHSSQFPLSCTFVHIKLFCSLILLAAANVTVSQTSQTPKCWHLSRVYDQLQIGDKVHDIALQISEFEEWLNSCIPLLK